MKAVILAGGLGTRLKPFTEIIPKPLLPLGEKSILEIQLTHLKNHGFKDVILATNYKSQYIENFFGDGSRLGVSLKFSKETKPLGTCGPLTLLADDLTEPFLVMNGDILTKLNFKDVFQFSEVRNALFTVVTKKIMLPFQFGNVLHDGDFIVGVDEKPDIILEIVGGIYIMKPEILKYIPKDTYFGIDQLIHVLIERSIPIHRYLADEYWLDIGQIDDYQKAQLEYKNHFNEDKHAGENK